MRYTTYNYILLLLFASSLCVACKQKGDISKLIVANKAGVLPADKDCILLTDFTNHKKNELWRTVNDNVMGGRSKGDFVMQNSTMIFSGSINTNGGGFSSVRMFLNGQDLESFETIQLRLRTMDFNREYRIIMEDKRRGSIVYRSPIPIQNTEDWQEVTMSLSDFIPTRRGDPISRPPFSKDAPYTIGFMLNDTGEGEFKLEADWIKLCN